MESASFIRPDWPAPPTVQAVSTTRLGGVSRMPYDSFNLGSRTGDDPAAVAENRRRLRIELGLPAEPSWLRQVHGARCLRAGSAQDAEADASWTDRPGGVCAVQTADCLPVLLCRRDGSAVAAVHAGWRGLAAGVIESAASNLGEGERMAWLGPAIGPDSFEVGAELREAFLARHTENAAAFRPQAGGKWLCDLYGLARLALRRVGIEAIYGGGADTLADPARFYSYRRERTTGRMATLIWIARRPDSRRP